jgi:hypothetical protein
MRGNPNPSPATRFSKDNPPKNPGRKKGRTATDWLHHLANTKIRFENPVTGKVETGPVNQVVALQLILKATQDSDLPSIREYLDRTDGKVVDKTELSGKLDVTQMGCIKLDGKPLEVKI